MIIYVGNLDSAKELALSQFKMLLCPSGCEGCIQCKTENHPDIQEWSPDLDIYEQPVLGEYKLILYSPKSVQESSKLLVTSEDLPSHVKLSILVQDLSELCLPLISRSDKIVTVPGQTVSLSPEQAKDVESLCLDGDIPGLWKVIKDLGHVPVRLHLIQWLWSSRLSTRYEVITRLMTARSVLQVQTSVMSLRGSKQS